jgi:urease accessory protein
VIRENLTELDALNRLARASIVPPTIRRASQEMGDQLVELGLTWAWCAHRLAALVSVLREHTHWHHAVAFGTLGALAEADEDEVLTAYLHQAVLGMVAAGVRAVPIGHTHGQQLIAYLHDDIRALVPSLLTRETATAGAGCPNYEVLCDDQTRLYARMFRS